jgi:hypothetical protein
VLDVLRCVSATDLAHSERCRGEPTRGVSCDMSMMACKMLLSISVTWAFSAEDQRELAWTGTEATHLEVDSTARGARA